MLVAGLGAFCPLFKSGLIFLLGPVLPGKSPEAVEGAFLISGLTGLAC